MSLQTASTIEQLRQAANPTPRISLTELSRSTKWRESMVEYAVVELCDHSETAGYLVSTVGMQDILARLEELERELEEAQIAALVARRAGSAVWKSGEELAEGAAAILQEQAEARRAR